MRRSALVAGAVILAALIPSVRHARVLEARPGQVIRGVDVAVWGRAYVVMGAARQNVTITLRSHSWTVKALRTERIRDDSTIDGRFDLVEGDAITPGDVLEIETTSGDPSVFFIPHLRARADPATDRVIGEAHVAGAVSVEVIRVAGSSGVLDVIATAAVTPTADGTFVADLSDVVDLVPGSAGRIVYADRAGVRYYAPWVIPQVRVDLDTGTMRVAATWRSLVAMRLYDKLGQEAVSYNVYAADGDLLPLHEVAWSPADITGSEVMYSDGWRIVVDVDGQGVTDAVVPVLRGALDIETDRLIGASEPGQTATVTLHRGTRAVTVTGTTAHDGALDQYVGDIWNVLPGDSAELGIAVNGNPFSRRIDPPQLVLDLDTCRVSGRVSPGEIMVELVDTHRRRGAVQSVVGSDGLMALMVEDGAGDTVCPARGDRYVVRQPKAAANKEIRIVVPLLTVTPQIRTGRIEGMTEPSAAVSLNAFSPYLQNALGDDPGASGRAVVVADEAGRFVAIFSPPLDFRAGQVVEASYVTDNDHLVKRRSMVPMLNIEVGGAVVCGMAAEGSPVDLALVSRGGETLGAGADTADAAGRFTVALRHRVTGALLTIASGMVVRAVIEGVAVEVAVPQLDVEPNWPMYTMPIRTVPDARGFVHHPASGCAADLDVQGGVAMARFTTDASGHATAIPQGVPGESSQVSVYLPQRHRAYRQLYRLQGRVFVHESRLGGKATPGYEVVMRGSHRGDGSESRAVATTDSNGRFRAQLQAAPGKPAIISALDEIFVSAPGDSARIDVQELIFDFSEHDGLVGIGPAGHEVALTLTLSSGESATIHLKIDHAGRFSFTSSDVPIQAPWSLGDVTRVLAVVRLRNGHELASDAVVGAPILTSIVLPWAWRGRTHR